MAKHIHRKPTTVVPPRYVPGKPTPITILSQANAAFLQNRIKDGIALLESSALETAQAKRLEIGDRLIISRLIVEYTKHHILDGTTPITETRYENIMAILSHAKVVVAELIKKDTLSMIENVQLQGRTPTQLKDIIDNLETALGEIDPIANPAGAAKPTPPPEPTPEPEKPAPAPKPTPVILPTHASPPPGIASQPVEAPRRAPVAEKPTPAAAAPAPDLRPEPPIVRNFRRPTISAASTLPPSKPEPVKPAEPEPVLTEAEQRIVQGLIRAKGLRENGRFKDAIPFFKLVLILDPNNTEARQGLNVCANGLVTLAERADSPKGGATLLAQAREAEPTDTAIIPRMAALDRRIKAELAPPTRPAPPPPTETPATPKTETDLRGAEVQRLIRSGRAKIAEGREFEALEQFLAVKVLDPRNHRNNTELSRLFGALRKRALKQKDQGDLQGAGQACELALKIRPDASDVLTLQGDIKRIIARQATTATANVQENTKPVPEQPIEASPASDRAAKRQATMARREFAARKERLLRFGLEALEKGEHEKAEALFRGLLKIDPDHETARLKLAEIEALSPPPPPPPPPEPEKKPEENPVPKPEPPKPEPNLAAAQPRRTRSKTPKPAKPVLDPKEIASRRARALAFLGEGNNLKLTATELLAENSRVYWLVYDKRLFPGGINEARVAATLYPEDKKLEKHE